MDIKPIDKKLPKDIETARAVTDWMCANFFDVRSFGAVMTTNINSGQVRGPVQLTFAKSEDPIVPLEISITRMAVTTEKEAEDQQGDNRTMGRKHIIPYGLYRCHGFISAKLAEKTGFSEDDLQKLWGSLRMMFEHDRSAARGEMVARKLVVFKHKDALGNMPAHKLFERVTISRVKGETGSSASGYDDYQINIETNGLNEKGVTVEEIIDGF